MSRIWVPRPESVLFDEGSLTAGHQFSVNRPVKTVTKVTNQVAAQSQFRVDETELFNFQLLKGNFAVLLIAVSLIAGAFIAYCDFVVELEDDEEGGTMFILNRNTH